MAKFLDNYYVMCICNKYCPLVLFGIQYSGNIWQGESLEIFADISIHQTKAIQNLHKVFKCTYINIHVQEITCGPCALQSLEIINTKGSGVTFCPNIVRSHNNI